MCARTLVRTRPDFAAAVAQACVDREDIYQEQTYEIAMQAHVIGAREARRRMAPLSKQLTRLRKRPGWTRRRWCFGCGADKPSRTLRGVSVGRLP